MKRKNKIPLILFAGIMMFTGGIVRAEEPVAADAADVFGLIEEEGAAEVNEDGQAIDAQALIGGAVDVPTPGEAYDSEAGSVANAQTAGETQDPEAGAALNEPTPAAAGEASAETVQDESIALDETWEWASNSQIHTGTATLYRSRAGEGKPEQQRHIVCVNAGHGTSRGADYQTLSHPDGTPKVTGGTNAEGAVWSTSISSGMTFLDGATEASVNLQVALALKDRLLAGGYDVLMIRESDDVQLDNIARTVIANNVADIHIAIHFDSTDSDKGVFFCSVPEDASYRQMEPVASHWAEHMELGQTLISVLPGDEIPVYGNGMLPMDLTQTSYSTIPSVDIELGDRASDHSQAFVERYAQALKDGIDLFFYNRFRKEKSV